MSTPEKLAERAVAVEWILRCGAFMCFVGHGAFGVLTKDAWVRYFAVVGIGPDTAYALMPVIGALDITMGVLALLVPAPIVAWWMVAWALWTATLRPMSGEPLAEALERAGNYGAPAAILLLMTWSRSWRNLLRVGFRPITAEIAGRLRMALIVATAMLLVGHGWLAVMHKPGIVANFASVMPLASAERLVPLAGWLEIALAVIVLLRPSITVMLLIVAWKVVTEALFVTAGSPVWEWVERGGSYCVPLALAVLLARFGSARSSSRGLSPKAGVAALALIVLMPIALAAQPSTVILVRHAEKASATERDPVLSDVGAQRAKDLAAALADAGIGSIVTTQLQRTKLTAADVMAATKLAPIVIQAGGPTHAADVAAAIRARPAGEVVLVVGHSNTVGPIITALGGPKMGDICDSQYSNLYILQLTAPTPKLIRANFGKPDPADPACNNMAK
jgi:phosphohistidine phosphatase SixA